MPTALSLDRYAEMRAEMESGRLRDEVLARAGLSADEWTAAQREWLDRMGNDIARGRFDLTNRYSQAFLARQRALSAPALSAPTPMPTAAAEAAPPLLDPMPRPKVQRPSGLLSGTMMADTSAFRAPALPFEVSHDGAASGPKPRAPSEPMPRAEPAARPVVNRAPAALTGTSMSFVVPKGPALPFAKGPPPAPPPPDDAAAPQPAPVPAKPAVNRAPAALTGTSMSFVVPKGPALPFASAPAAPPVPAPQPAPAPQASPPAAVGPALSLEYYAAAGVELSLDARRTAEILQRYGLRDMAAWQAVDREWQGRIAADPAVAARFQQLLAHYRAHYARG